MPNTLITGQFLRTGEYLTAADGSCFIVIQRDGNLCLYEGGSPSQQGRYLWSSLAKAEPEGDYFAIMQGDGNFVVYQGTPERQGRCIWATYALAGGGRFVAVVEPGGNFTVSIGTAADRGRLLWAARHRLRVLTYNTHLIEGSNIEVGAWWADKKPVVFHDEPRHAQIVSKVLASGADVVALQEVWSADRMNRFRDDLHSVYPHYIRGTNGPVTKAGSGIILVSKHPITDWNFVEFKDPHDSEDKHACKGLLCATIELGEVKLRVGMTHAWTDAGGTECTNIRDLIHQTMSDSNLPGVLMGDFNIHRMGEPAKFKKLTELMAAVGASDSWTAVHGPDADAASATDDQVNNTLDQFFSPDRDTPAPDCIDYIYLRNTKSHVLRPISAEVPRTWRESTGDRNPKWYWVHPGNVGGQPSGAVFGDKMCVVVRKADDAKLMVAVFNKADKRWVHQTIKQNNVEVTTDGSPGVVWFNHRLHLFFRQGHQVYKMESEDGLTWTNKDSQGSGFQTSGGVTPVVFRNTLYVFVRDPTGKSVFFHVWSNRWSDRQRVHIDTKRDIAAAVLDDKLCVVCRDGDSPGDTGGVMWAVLDAADKWSCGHIGNTVASGSPGITVHDRQFKVFYRERDGGGIFACASRTGKDGWYDLPFTHHATTDEVCPMVWEDRLMLFYSFVHKSHLIYAPRALAHGYYPGQVDLDASDHYPYQVDFVWSPNR